MLMDTFLFLSMKSLKIK